MPIDLATIWAGLIAALALASERGDGASGRGEDDER